jgi:peptidoglycan/LPS O-acetylase OafA/YrhL
VEREPAVVHPRKLDVDHEVLHAGRRIVDMSDPISPVVSRSPTGRPFLSELGAARAFAVVVVLIYHLWPVGLPGGFVGVDILFVVSGYLITQLIARELQSTGRLRIGAFFARRIVRLVPAAAVVVAATSLLTLLFAPHSQWRESAREALASALYGENWYLALESKSYVTASQDPSAFQHYWSLGVEAQLYLLWPFLLLLAIALGVLLPRLAFRTRIVMILGAIFGFSLIWSVAQVSVEPTVAFYSTATRAWEFAGGGLLAVLIPKFRVGVRVTSALLGWTILAASVALLPGTAGVPGFVSLAPILGTALVIAGGSLAPYRNRGIQFVGVISYSLYLWHWPLIVLWPDLTGAPRTWSDDIAIAGMSLLLAWLTTVAVERRFWRPRAPRSRRRLVAAVSFSLLIAVVSVGISLSQLSTVHGEGASEARAIAALTANSGRCFGAAALAHSSCAAARVPDASQLSFAAADWGIIWGQRVLPGLACQQASDGDGEYNINCASNHMDKSWPTVVLAGDSHIGQWVDSFIALAPAEHWNLMVLEHGGCPLMQTAGLVARSANITSGCVRWAHSTLKAIAANPAISMVVTSGYFGAYAQQGIDSRQASLQTPALARRVADGLTTLRRAGKGVLFIGDTPHSTSTPATCLATEPAPLTSCSYVPTDTGFQDGVTPIVRKLLAGKGVNFIDPTPWFCANLSCPPVIGQVVVDTDNNHTTRTYAISLAPLLGAKLAQLGIVGSKSISG